MQVVSYSEARNSLKAVLDQVVNDADVTIINRRDAANTVVMSLDCQTACNTFQISGGNSVQ